MVYVLRGVFLMLPQKSHSNQTINNRHVCISNYLVPLIVTLYYDFFMVHYKLVEIFAQNVNVVLLSYMFSY